MRRGKRILLRASTGFSIEVVTGGFYSVKHPKQARYQLRYTRITYFVVVNYVVKMILPQKRLTFKRGKVAEFAYKSGKIAHLQGDFQNSVGSPKAGALPTALHPDTKCIIHDIRRKCKYILQKIFRL